MKEGYFFNFFCFYLERDRVGKRGGGVGVREGGGIDWVIVVLVGEDNETTRSFQ